MLSSSGKGGKGINGDTKIVIRGGKVQIYAADDALNSGYSSESIAEKQKMGIDVSSLKADAGQIIVSGGELYAYSTSNDAIDANGTISVTGGLAVAVGAGAPEKGFDCDNNTFAIKGGTLLISSPSFAKGGSYTFGDSSISCASDK